MEVYKKVFVKMLAPLILANVAGEVRGKTRFQKLMFLVQKKALSRGFDEINLNFKLHNYGPFSQELTWTIDNLLVRNYLKESVEATPSGYIRHTYHLTPEGSAIVQEALERRMFPPELLQIFQEVVKEYGDMTLEGLVQIAYEQFS